MDELQRIPVLEQAIIMAKAYKNVALVMTVFQKLYEVHGQIIQKEKRFVSLSETVEKLCNNYEVKK